MIRSVIDTNVLVSGLLSPSGNEVPILPSGRQRSGASLLFGRDPRRMRGCARAAEIAFPPEKIAAVLASAASTSPFSLDRGQHLLATGSSPSSLPRRRPRVTAVDDPSRPPSASARGPAGPRLVVTRPAAIGASIELGLAAPDLAAEFAMTL